MSAPITVNCDEEGCGWSDRIDAAAALRAYVLSPCPKCGCGELLSAADVVVLGGILALQKLGLARVVPKPVKGSIRIDTARLRRNP